MHSSAHSLERVPKNSTRGCKELIIQYKSFHSHRGKNQIKAQEHTNLQLNCMCIHNDTFNIWQFSVVLRRRKIIIIQRIIAAPY